MDGQVATVARANAAEAGGTGARERMLTAAEHCLVRDGFAGLSTRAVAQMAEVPLSQIHYHFGSKQGLLLALLDHQNRKLLLRQAQMFGADAALSARWYQACEFLEEDIASGYVRVLQEIVSAGYAEPALAAAARKALAGWFTLLTQVSAEVRTAFGGPEDIADEELGTLLGLAFLGAESMLLLGMDLPIIASLRAVGRSLERLEVRHAR